MRLRRPCYRGGWLRAAVVFSSIAAMLGLAMVRSSVAAEMSLVVVSPHNEAIRTEFERAFSEWHRDQFGDSVDIDWRVVGGSSESVRFVQSEFARKPDGIGVDVFFGGGQEPFYELASKRLLDPWRLPAELLEGLPAEVVGIELRAPDFGWYGAALSSFGILQNLRVQAASRLPRIERWEDLARPELFGWVGAGDPRGSGTMHVMFESFLQARGWEPGWQLLARLAGNTRRFDRISSTTAKDAALGQTAYALAVDFYAFTQIAVAGRTNLAFVLPTDFASLNCDGIAILHGAPHRDTARRFLEFVLSEPGQKLWFLPRGHPEGPRRFSIERLPVRPAMYERYREVSNIQLSPFELRSRFLYDARLAQKRRGVVATLAGALLVDVHPELQRAWRAVIARGQRPDEVAELGRMPVTEAEALALAGEPWKDAARRNSLKTEWQVWARDKYRRLAKQPAASVTTPLP